MELNICIRCFGCEMRATATFLINNKNSWFKSRVKIKCLLLFDCCCFCGTRKHLYRSNRRTNNERLRYRPNDRPKNKCIRIILLSFCKPQIVIIRLNRVNFFILAGLNIKFYSLCVNFDRLFIHINCALNLSRSLDRIDTMHILVVMRSKIQCSKCINYEITETIEHLAEYREKQKHTQREWLKKRERLSEWACEMNRRSAQLQKTGTNTCIWYVVGNASEHAYVMTCKETEIK